MERRPGAGRGIHEFSLDALDGARSPARSARVEDLAARDALGRAHSRRQPRRREANCGDAGARVAARGNARRLVDGSVLPARVLDASRDGGRPRDADRLGVAAPGASDPRPVSRDRSRRARGAHGARDPHATGRRGAVRRRRGVRRSDESPGASSSGRAGSWRRDRGDVRHPLGVSIFLLWHLAAEHVLPEGEWSRAGRAPRSRTSRPRRLRPAALSRAGRIVVELYDFCRA